jgi:hypothetical protein
MKKWEINKRKLASIAVLLSIASIGIFAGTYAKYVSELSLTDESDTDLSARVAIWNVGQNKKISINLFDKYYYGASGDENQSYANSGHEVRSADYDTVFANSTDHNVIAPGTHGYKTIQITNQVDDTRGVTEVTYKISAVDDDKVSDTIVDDPQNLLTKERLYFGVAINVEVDKYGNLDIDWTNENMPTYLLDGEAEPFRLLCGEAINGNMLYNGFEENIKGIKNIVVVWKWAFDSEDEDAATVDSEDTELGMTTPIPKIIVDFGAARVEQVD